MRAKNLFIGQKVSLLQCVQMAYIVTKTSKITKLHELSLLHKGNLGSKPKSDKRVKNGKSAGRVNSGRNCEQWQEVISQPAKFRSLPNFLQAPISLHFLLFFPSSF